MTTGTLPEFSRYGHGVDTHAAYRRSVVLAGLGGIGLVLAPDLVIRAFARLGFGSGTEAAAVSILAYWFVLMALVLAGWSRGMWSRELDA